jgi:hypothetical protein
MSNPWDRPPIPPRGDYSEDITYRSVGRFISSWESIEVELSHLYAIFVGKYFKPEAYDEYHDQSKTLKQRLRTLEEAARLYFVSVAVRSPRSPRHENGTPSQRRYPAAPDGCSRLPKHRHPSEKEGSLCRRSRLPL